MTCTPADAIARLSISSAADDDPPINRLTENEDALRCILHLTDTTSLLSALTTCHTLRTLALATLSNAEWRALQPPAALWAAGLHRRSLLRVGADGRSDNVLSVALEAGVLAMSSLEQRLQTSGGAAAQLDAIALKVALSPDGSRLAASFEDGSLRVYALPPSARGALAADAEPVLVPDTLTAPPAAARAATRRPGDGGSGGADGEGGGDSVHGGGVVAAALAPLCQCALHDGPVAALAWATARVLLSGGTDSALRQWEVSSGLCRPHPSSLCLSSR